MEIYKRFNKPIERQLFEAMKIAKAGGLESTTVLNQKEENTRCGIPEIKMTHDPKPQLMTQKRSREHMNAEDDQTNTQEASSKKRRTTLQELRVAAENNSSSNTDGEREHKKTPNSSLIPNKNQKIETKNNPPR